MPLAHPEPYRAAVIGCGSVGSDIADRLLQMSVRMALPYGHAPALRAVSRVRLVGGADLDAGRRRAFAERWALPAEHVYPDYHDLLARERIELVSIATPTPSHVEVALAAIEAGARAIYLEKPIASSLADADRLVAACARASVPLAVNHSRRGDQIYRKAKQLIDEGAIGRLHSLIAHFAGHLMVTGSHALDLLNFFNSDQPAAWIVGHLDDPPGFDPGGSAYLVYANGVRALVNGSSGGSVMFRLQAIGTAGEIVIGNHELELNRSNPASRDHELVRYPFPQVLLAASPMTVMIDELLDALESGAPMSSTGETATSALELIVGLHLSHRQGSQPIRLPVDERTFTIPSL
ncbi:MAG: Gfo/Idh/MocA family protein [Chloroflexota bacterium]